MAFTEYERRTIMSLRKTSKGNANLAARMCYEDYDFPYKPSDSAIRKMWEKWGIPSDTKQGGHRSGLTREQFKAIYKECNGDIAKMMVRAYYKRSDTLVKLCEQSNLKYHNVPEEPSRNGSGLSVKNGRVLTDMVGVRRLGKSY